METLLLAASGLIFGVLFVLNVLVKTLGRRHKVGFIDLLLAFTTTVLLVLALVYNSLPDAAPPPLDLGVGVRVVVLGAAAVLFIFSLIITLAESRREQKLRGSRGILGLWASILVVVSALAVPYVSDYFAVTPVAPTLIAASGAVVTEEPSSEDLRREAFYTAVVTVVSEETALDEADVRERLDSGTTVAEIVEGTEADLETIIERVTELMRAEIADMQANDELNRIQATLILSQVEGFVRRAANQDLNELRQAELPAEATDALDEPTETPESTASPTPSRTPTMTRTPRPTPSPTETRERFTFASRTPTPTETLVTPCVAVVNYNLRLRSAPDPDSETLAVIPFETTISLYGRRADSAYWYTIYEGEEGWIDGEFITTTSACEELPVREAE